MKSILLNNEQFNISIDTFESTSLSMEYDNEKLFIKVKDVGLLVNLEDLEFYSPKVSYDEWLNSNRDNLSYVKYIGNVTFVITNPSIYYGGSQSEFINKFIDLELTSGRNSYSYVFGGVLEDSNFDEFEVSSNKPIEFYYDDVLLREFIKNN